MKVSIVGLPYFSCKLAKKLALYDKNNVYVAYNTFYSRYEQVKYIFDLCNTDIVYSIGGCIKGNRTIDMALATGKTVIMHWVGTDVLEATNDYKKGIFKKPYFKNIRHLCEVSWIQDELKLIGINADAAQFITFDDAYAVFGGFPEQFSILSYVGKGREKFYGIDMLIKLALDFPAVEIKVTGISNYMEQMLPTNLKLLGWVDSMNEQYLNCVLYLRLPQHDGLAFSVLEALRNGRYVGYSQKLEHTYHIDNYASLHKLTSGLIKKWLAKDLSENVDGMNYVAKVYSESDVLDNLLTLFKDN
jgi:hypothetical protein